VGDDSGGDVVGGSGVDGWVLWWKAPVLSWLPSYRNVHHFPQDNSFRLFSIHLLTIYLI